MINELLTELRIFLKAIARWVLLLVILTLFCFTFNVRDVVVFGYILPLPLPTQESIASDVYQHIFVSLAPAEVPLIVTDPTTAFVVQFKIAFLLAFMVTFPVLVLQLVQYLTPALYAHERRFLWWLIVPFSGLFFAGVWFAQAWVVRPVLEILYSYAGTIGAVPMIGVGEFASTVIMLFLWTGLSFTTPVAMVLLSAVGLIPGVFWWQHIRGAAILFLIVSAIITPDGSGVSMLLLAAPVMTLYMIGALVSIFVSRKRHRHNTQSVEDISN